MKLDKKHLILALWTGLLCGLWAGFAGMAGLVVWLGFAGCTTYFACGKDRFEGLAMAVVTTFLGAIYGWLMQLIAVELGGGSLGYTVGVGLLVAAIIMTGKIKWAAFIPGMFVGCFTFFGYSGSVASTDYAGTILPALLISLAAGALLGMLCSWGAEILGKSLVKSQKSNRS